ncbi:EcoAI/FtnUII family type I restriction enzme subunit R, partial [Accumulibacter sp.]|uniref:EcoAI/FtnUII family type I restriction enzme subunit R n=1 Tax=Accumulibacter sp. TaxID=2053492 RepID=UPI0025B9486B
MDNNEKKELSESDIKAKFITPAIVQAGWDEMTQIRREVTLTPGPVIVRGNLSSRNKKKKKFADYVLQKEKGVPVAVVEAKENNYTISHGLQQALGYAEILEVPCAFSSNGDGFASHNKAAAEGEDTETEFGLEVFPSPTELWERYKRFRGITEDQETLVTEPYHDDGGGKEPRYYQAEAVNRVIEKVAQGEKRLLLVMATGTGKTYTTFQIIYRLWKAKKAKRILFLVDRNVLADQTLVNDFKPFGSVMTKIRNRKIDPAYEVYLGLYQALTGPDDEDKIFKSVKHDFFDLIVIDECHRGSANDDSAWKEILEYFDGAIQLGMTATPKRTDNVDTYAYFGEPVFTYSLGQGIDDGFLANYKVHHVRSNLDRDGLSLAEAQQEGAHSYIPEDATPRPEYGTPSFERDITVPDRVRLHCEHLVNLLRIYGRMEKTIVY